MKKHGKFVDEEELVNILPELRKFVDEEELLVIDLGDGRFEVDVIGDVDLSFLELTSLREIPIRIIRVVAGNFWCSFNKLTSLEGAPEIVHGDFVCSFNNLTSLEGAPKHVGKDFSCSCNKLITLKGAPKEVGGNFYCNDNSKRFTEEEVRKLVNVKGIVIV
jgi:hypothetical protein